jgi:polysaccharide deacetylase 2 family uncharacterized protein YibQ
MTTSFNLQWNELSLELREQKIREYIENTFDDISYEYAVNNYEGDALDDDEFDAFKADVTVDELFDDEHTYKDVERSIEARFPIYF